MKTAEMNLMDWQERFGSEASCAQALARQRWPEGFRCPDVDMIMVTPLPRASPGNVTTATPRPR